MSDYQLTPSEKATLAKLKLAYKSHKPIPGSKPMSREKMADPLNVVQKPLKNDIGKTVDN